MSNRPVLPEKLSYTEIAEMMGTVSWGAFAWALEHGWVQDYKSNTSSDVGHDIGTPATVR
jgi:hypothetical protein